MEYQVYNEIYQSNLIEIFHLHAVDVFIFFFCTGYGLTWNQIQRSVFTHLIYIPNIIEQKTCKVF